MLCWYGFISNPSAPLHFLDSIIAGSSRGWVNLAYLVSGLLTLGSSVYLGFLVFGRDIRRERRLFFEAEAGPIGISLDAVEEFIKRKSRSISELRDLQVRAIVEEDGLLIRCRIVLELQRNVADFTRDFQQKIHHDLSQSLGVSNIKGVEVLITKLLPLEPVSEPILLVSSNEDKQSDTNYRKLTSSGQ